MLVRVLVVDDDRAECELLADGLSAADFDVTWTQDPEQALRLLAEQSFDVLITDLSMPKLPGLALCREATRLAPGMPVVVVTAFGTIDSAVDAMRAGAYDFVTKPFDLDAVALSLHRAADHSALKKEVENLRRAVDAASRFGPLLGTSDVMHTLYDLIERVADSQAAVLITGESGTGKELVAREIHRRGNRREGPFVALNCAAMPESLLESELFGHVRGAFTDAKTSREGLLVQASGGSFFLDEIGDMPPGLQPKLLRALQERAVRPVGSGTERPFDARIVAATNRDLEVAIEEKSFREDLYYRLNVVELNVPPLRTRGSDILTMSRSFLAEFAAQTGKRVTDVTSEAAERLLSYEWPGNVRELRNCMERAVALTRAEMLGVDDLPKKIRDYQARTLVVTGNNPAEMAPLAEIERRYVTNVLNACNGNKSLAAKVLGVSRKTLYRHLGGVDEAKALEKLSPNPRTDTS